MNSMERRIHAVAEMSRGKSEGEIQRASDYLHGVADKALSDRIETFGAIRRSAAVARRLEGLSEAEGDAWALRADAARMTIRAALKADASE